jgi:hypothetical protein
VHKLALIHTLIRGPLFADRRSRLGLVSAVCRWIDECLRGDWDVEKSASNPALARDTRRLCLNVALELVERLQKVGDRLERGKLDEKRSSKDQNGGMGDTKSREEDLKKCLDQLSSLLPTLLESYNRVLYPPESSAHDFIPGVNDSESNPRRSTAESLSSEGAFSSPKNTSPSIMMAPTNSPSIKSPTIMSPLEMPPGQKFISTTLEYQPVEIERSELASTIICLLNILPKSHIRTMFSRPAADKNQSQGSFARYHSITSLLMVLQSLMSGSTFPHSWAGVNMVVCRITIKILRVIGDVLKSDTSHHHTELVSRGSAALDSEKSELKRSKSIDDSNRRQYQILWADYFRILLLLLNSKWVAVETFPPQKARAGHRLGADVRGDAGDLLRSIWEYLIGEEKADYGFQMTFIPNLFGPFLELTMSPHPKLKVAAVELLFRFDFLYVFNLKTKLLMIVVKLVL